MATNSTLNIRKIDLSNINEEITFSDAIRNKKTNAVSVNILYRGQKTLFRLPKLAFPGGAIIKSVDSGATTYTMIASLTDCDKYGNEPGDNETDSGYTYNFFRGLEQRVLDAAFENSARWFGKKRSMESLKETFKNIVSFSVDKTPGGEYVMNGKYDPSVRFKINVWDGQVKTEAMDGESNPLELTVDNLGQMFPKRCSAKLVIIPTIYVAGLSFGVTLKIDSAQVYHQHRSTIQDKFRDDDDDHEVVQTKKYVTPVASEEDEDEVAELVKQYEELHPPAAAPAPEPTPAPTPAPASGGAGGRRRVKQ